MLESCSQRRPAERNDVGRTEQGELSGEMVRDAPVDYGRRRILESSLVWDDGALNRVNQEEALCGEIVPWAVERGGNHGTQLVVGVVGRALRGGEDVDAFLVGWGDSSQEEADGSPRRCCLLASRKGYPAMPDAGGAASDVLLNTVPRILGPQAQVARPANGAAALCRRPDAPTA